MEKKSYSPINIQEREKKNTNSNESIRTDYILAHLPKENGNFACHFSHFSTKCDRPRIRLIHHFFPFNFAMNPNQSTNFVGKYSRLESTLNEGHLFRAKEKDGK